MIIRDMIEKSGKDYAGYPAIRWLEGKEVKEIEYQDLMQEIGVLRRGLVGEGFDRKHIALIGISSLPWIECYTAIISGTGTAITLDAGLPVEDLVDLLERSDSEALFLGKTHLPMLEPLRKACSRLKKIWIMTEDELDIDDDAVENLTALKSHAGEDDPKPDGEDISMIIFTSGTTGKSKGVMLTQNNLAANLDSIDYKTHPGEVVRLSVLPIHHSFCLMNEWMKGFQLGSIICINDSLMHLVRNIGLFKPKIILMVPLMIESIYKRLSAMKDVTPDEIHEKVFGGNLKYIFTGGAHLDDFYIDEYKKWHIQILEGYGMSECSPTISTNSTTDHKDGSIGKLVPNLEVKFVDGEILVRGTSVMHGYYKMEEETKEILDEDGWLHTGDLGYMDEDGFLWISGRKKNLIILSNGENISPEELEVKLALNPLIGEVVITGEDNRLTARVFPDPDVVEAKSLSPEQVEAGIRAAIDEFNSKQPSYRQIMGLIIRKNPFIKSATRKIRRQDILIDEPVE